MITIPWHLIAYIVFVVICIYKMCKETNTGIGDGLHFILWLWALVLVTATYGGIFWW